VGKHFYALKRKEKREVATARPITLQISDIIRWYKSKELIVNATFQRHSVWSQSAKTYLIDTILQELPLPKLYLRTKIDAKTQTSIREIVDGQQRVRAMVAFANDELRLTKRSEQYAGQNYSDLDEETQQRFLGYTLTADQLLNASDDDVIDVFARLNSYTVALNAAEKRHAEFQTDFKFSVRKASQNHRRFIERYCIFTTKQRFRMADDAFFAEAFGVFLEGVKDGGEARIRKLYLRQNDKTFGENISRKVTTRLEHCITFLDNHLEELLDGPLGKHYQVLMLIAAYAHIKYGIPQGDLDNLPPRRTIASREVMIKRLETLTVSLEMEAPLAEHKEFVNASRSSTQRIATRKVRFLTFLQALQR